MVVYGVGPAAIFSPRARAGRGAAGTRGGPIPTTSAAATCAGDSPGAAEHPLSYPSRRATPLPERSGSIFGHRVVGIFGGKRHVEFLARNPPYYR